VIIETPLAPGHLIGRRRIDRSAEQSYSVIVRSTRFADRYRTMSQIDESVDTVIVRTGLTGYHPASATGRV
jgi:hypothetical protein